MNNFKLQVPIDKKTKSQADRKAEEIGFSSLQEFIRVFLKNFVLGNVIMNFYSPISPKNKLLKKSKK